VLAIVVTRLTVVGSFLAGWPIRQRFRGMAWCFFIWMIGSTGSRPGSRVTRHCVGKGCCFQYTLVLEASWVTSVRSARNFELERCLCGVLRDVSSGHVQIRSRPGRRPHANLGATRLQNIWLGGRADPGPRPAWRWAVCFGFTLSYRMNSLRTLRLRDPLNHAATGDPAMTLQSGASRALYALGTVTDAGIVSEPSALVWAGSSEIQKRAEPPAYSRRIARLRIKYGLPERALSSFGGCEHAVCETSPRWTAVNLQSAGRCLTAASCGPAGLWEDNYIAHESRAHEDPTGGEDS
jgi:hypothetical protein